MNARSGSRQKAASAALALRSGETAAQDQSGIKIAKKTKSESPPQTLLVGHGLTLLPSVTVDSYNLDVKDGPDILNHKLRKAAFFELLDDLRAPLANRGNDPFGHEPSVDIGFKELAKLLDGDNAVAKNIVKAAMEAFSVEIATVLTHFLHTKQWAGVERIVVGGGFRNGNIGEQCIARSNEILAKQGIEIELVPVRHHADDAGLIGGVHLLPSWTLKGHQAMLAIDIGGTNLRVGIVELNLDQAADLSKASVWKSEIWRHADDEPKRTQTVEELVGMLQGMIGHASDRKLDLAPVITLGCPGVIDADGSILRGGVNLPGGNWESARFNLPSQITKDIGRIGEHETIVRMHNDAVVQGLSQLPWMGDVSKWAVITIGTGLGNASFTNRR